MTPKRQRTLEVHMHDIWSAWDYHFTEKVEALDHMTRHIFSEMALFGVPANMAQEFMQNRFREKVKAVGRERSA